MGVIQFKRGTAASWTANNPILANGEIGVELVTKLYKMGDGVTPWNSLGYNPLSDINNANVVLFANQAEPTSPTTGNLNVYAKSIASRMFLRAQGPSGISTPLQPALFQNNVYFINSNSATALTMVGDSVVSVGTVSHPVVTELYGRMANFASAATANITCGTGTANVNFFRGSIVGSNGFFMAQKLAFPDGSYNETGVTTGTRIFVGMTDQAMSTAVLANNPVGNRFGFSRIHVNASLTDTNWFITSRDGTNETRVDTGMAFTAQKVYQFYLFCKPQGNEIFWRIDNVTDGTSFEGSTTATLPTNTVAMRAGFQLQTVNALSRNIRM